MLPSDDEDDEETEALESDELSERQRVLLNKCLKLLTGTGGDNNCLTSSVTPSLESSSTDENRNMSISQYSFTSSTPSLTEASNEWQLRQKNFEKRSDPVHYFIPDLEEIALSSMVTRKGYLNVLEHGCSGWKKRWIVVRRPYIFIFKSDRDNIERAVLNLNNAQVECSEDQMAMIKIPNTFRWAKFNYHSLVHKKNN